MSTEAARVYRLAFGMTLSAGVALGIAWPFSFITPVITAKLLCSPKVLPLKGAVGLLVVLSVSLILSSLLLVPTLQYPVVHVLLTGLLVFLLFYAKAGGVNPMLAVLLLIAVLVIPLFGTVAEALAWVVTKGFIVATLAGLVFVYIAAAAFPDPPASGPTVRWSNSDPSANEKKREQDVSDAAPPTNVRAGLALRSLLVLFPLAIAFQLLSLVNFVVVLIMVLLLALEPMFGKHLKTGKGLILANAAGGLIAVLIYNLLVWVPSYPFFLLLVLLAGLLVGPVIFSERPLGKLLGAGITTVFLILGPVVTGDEQAGQELYLRVMMIIGAVVYVVLAFGLLERLTRGRRWVTAT